MRYDELFKHIKEKKDWIKTGSDIDWFLEVDLENKIIRLLFQESSTKLDWKHNLAFFSKVYKKQDSVLIAHHGFADAYKTANDTIMDAVLKAIEEHPDFKIVIAGWSNGGASTQLAVEDLNYRTRTDKKDVNTGRKAVCVTFGAPKVFVGNKCRNYVVSCCDKIIQVANNNDIVTYMPPLPWYKHLLLSKRLRVGDKFSIIKIFKPTVYHTTYDQIDLYKVDGPLGREIV